MLDYQSLLYDPVYGVIGVPAVLWMGVPLGNVPLTVIDKTAGLMINAAVDLQTTAPVATVRAAELLAAGVALADIDGKLLTLNGKDWRIASFDLRPAPTGQSDGEVYLFLDGGMG